MTTPMPPLPDSFRGATALVAAINETYSLRETVETLLAAAGPAQQPAIVEILLLLSPKKTTPDCLATAKSLEREGPVPVRILYQSLPFAGGAYRDGFEAARGSHVVMLSADLETDPHLVPRMLEEARKAPRSVIATSRWIQGGSFHGYNPVKQVCNAVFQKLLSLVYLTRLTDLTFGFRVFPTALVRAIQWRELRHPFFLETCVVPLRLGIPFVEIPARWEPRPEGESQNSFFANFRYFKTAFRVRFTPRDRLLRTPR